MININITPEGEINISSESGWERAVMHKVYGGEEADTPDYSSDMTVDDEVRSEYFKRGWDSALQESMLRYVSGGSEGLEEFWNEVDPYREATEATPDEGEQEYSYEDRHGDPDERDSENWSERGSVADVMKNRHDSTEVIIDMDENAILRANEFVMGTTESTRENTGWPDDTASSVNWTPADGPGEDVGETVITETTHGVWTLTQEELESREKAAYDRGAADQRGFSVPLKFSQIRGAFDRAVSDVNEQIERIEESLDDKTVRIEPDRTNLVLTGLFRELGIEVTR